MSKAVTNEEVEDVLSSIRRLVSEDKRPLAGLRATPSEPATPEADTAEDAPEASETEVTTPEVAEVGGAAAPSDHFVLTPALRIAEPPEQTAEEAPLDLGLVARETWSDDGDETEGQNSAEGASEGDTNAPLVLFPTEEETDHDNGRTDGEDPAMDAVDALVHDALEADAQDEAGEDDDTDGDYADESYWDEEDTPEEVAEDSEPEVAQDETSETSESADEADPQDAPDAEAISILPLTAKIAALEAAVGGINQEWEPDGSEEADMATADAPAMAWEDDVDLDAKGAPIADEPVKVDETPEFEETDQTTEADHADEAKPAMAGLSADDQLLDEEALHALVSEIVRKELQGALGERITRNVRKLVRREIHRAITAQELE